MKARVGQTGAPHGRKRLARALLFVAMPLVFVALAALVACVNEPYDSGDGGNSYLQAHFAEAHTAANGTLAFAVTDDGDTLRFPPNTVVKALSRADSLYRVLFYYDRRGTTVNPRGIVPIPVVALSDSATAPTHPVTFESAWVSKSKRYFNIAFLLKTGKSNEPDKRQWVGVVRDSLVASANGQHTLYLHLAHNQNDVPGYYSQRVYISVPLKGLPPNTRFVFHINDYRRVITVERGI